MKTERRMRLIAERMDDAPWALRKTPWREGQVVICRRSTTGWVRMTDIVVEEQGDPDHMLRYQHYTESECPAPVSEGEKK